MGVRGGKRGRKRGKVGVEGRREEEVRRGKERKGE